MLDISTILNVMTLSVVKKIHVAEKMKALATDELRQRQNF